MVAGKRIVAELLKVPPGGVAVFLHPAQAGEVSLELSWWARNTENR